jgi:hypothetical protein
LEGYLLQNKYFTAIKCIQADYFLTGGQGTRGELCKLDEIPVNATFPKDGCAGSYGIKNNILFCAYKGTGGTNKP